MIQYAAKRLSTADLAFFKCHARAAYAAKANSIKLDANVLVENMYPYLRTAASTDPVRALVLLSIYGPGSRSSPDNKTRMLLAHSSNQRTWHLTGECIPDPDDDHARYHGLTASDFAVLAIRESEFQPIPKYVSIVLLAQSDVRDAIPFSILRAGMAERRFMTLPPATVWAQQAASSADHPLCLLDQLGAPN